MGKVEEYAKGKPVLGNTCAAFQAYDFTLESGSITLSDYGKEAIT